MRAHPRVGQLHRSGAFAALAAVTIMLGGCVERKERIVVRQDGSVELSVEHRSDSLEDLLDGDALPDGRAGWETNVSSEADDGGKIVHRFEARLATTIEAMPGTYGPPRDPGASRFLQFPTTITVERRRDGTWFHFRRTYEPRRWAELAAINESPAAQRLRQSGEGPGVEARNVDELEALARALVDVQVERTLLLVRRALLEGVPNASQDGWLRAEERMERLALEIDARSAAEEFARAVVVDDEAKRLEVMKKALKRLEATVDEQITLAVKTECSLGGSEASAFVRSLAQQRLESEVSEDIADDAFEVVVEMPGEIMGANTSDRRGNAAQWKFKGEAMFDRPRELLVSSRVAG